MSYEFRFYVSAVIVGVCVGLGFSAACCRRFGTSASLCLAACMAGLWMWDR